MQWCASWFAMISVLVVSLTWWNSNFAWVCFFIQVSKWSQSGTNAISCVLHINDFSTSDIHLIYPHWKTLWHQFLVPLKFLCIRLVLQWHNDFRYIYMHKNRNLQCSPAFQKCYVYLLIFNMLKRVKTWWLFSYWSLFGGNNKWCISYSQLYRPYILNCGFVSAVQENLINTYTCYKARSSICPLTCKTRVFLV